MAMATVGKKMAMATVGRRWKVLTPQIRYLSTQQSPTPNPKPIEEQSMYPRLDRINEVIGDSVVVPVYLFTAGVAAHQIYLKTKMLEPAFKTIDCFQFPSIRRKNHVQYIFNMRGFENEEIYPRITINGQLEVSGTEITRQCVRGPYYVTLPRGSYEEASLSRHFDPQSGYLTIKIENFYYDGHVLTRNGEKAGTTRNQRDTMRTMISGMKWKTLGLPRSRSLSTKHLAEEEESMFYFYYKKFKSFIQKTEDPSVSTSKHIFLSIVGLISTSATAGPILIARFSEAVHAPKYESAERMEYVFNVDGALDDDKIITELTPSHHLTVICFNSAGKVRYKYKYLLPFRNYKKIRLEGKLKKGCWIVYIHGDFQKYLEESESRKYMNVVFKELTDSVEADKMSGELYG